MSIRETIYLNIAPYKKSLDEAGRATRDFSDKQKRNFRQAGDAAERSSKRTESSFKRIGRSAKLWIAGAAAAALAAFVSVLRKGSDLAQSIEETASKFKTVLGPSIDDANSFIEENATLMGLSNRQAQEMIATTTAISQGFGFEGDAAAEFSQEVIKLAGDLQSFNDVPIARTQNAIVTALSGEREALKTLGIVVRQAEVNQRAMANTGIDNAEALDQQQKAAATLQLITEKAGVAVGDLARTQDSASNRSRQVWAEMLNIAEILSTKLNPAIDRTLNFIEPLVDSIKDWVDTPLSESIQQEQADLNVLVSQITAANTSQRRRNNLIQSLQSEYPDFLGNLDAESVTNGELASRLNEVNDAYIRKIAIQKQQENLADVIEQQSNAYRNQELAAQRIRQEIAELNQFSDIDIGLTGRSIEQIMSEARAELGGNTFTGDALFRLNKLMDNYTDAADEAAEAEKNISNETEILNKVIDRYGKSVRQVNLDHKSTRDELMAQRDEITKQISKYKEGTQQYKIYAESLAKVNQRISALGRDDSGGKTAADYVAETRKEYEKFLALQRNFDLTDILAGDGRRSGLQNFITNIEASLKKLGSSDIIGGHIDNAVSYVQRYNEELTRLNNLRDSGNISAEEYQRRANKASETYLQNLKGIYNLVKGKLSPAQEKMFKDLFGSFEDASGQAEDFKTNLDDIADSVDAIVNVADAFGQIGENAKDSLRGISDVLRGVQNIKELSANDNLTALSGALPAIGIAGGVASLASGLFNNSASEQERQRISDLANEMRSLKRAIAENTQALLREGLVGSDISKSQRDQANSIIRNINQSISGDLFSRLLGTDFGNKGLEDKIVKNFIEGEGLKDLFNQLSETGIEGFENFSGENLIKKLDVIGGENAQFEDLQQAIQQLINGSEGAATILGTLENNLGSYGDSLDGAITRLNTTTKLGLDEGQAFDTFISDVIGLIGGNNRLTNILEQIADADSEEGRKKLANELFKAFQENINLLGPDLTGADLQEVIDIILGISDPAEQSGTEGSVPDRYSRSTQVANTITEVQANEFIFFLERIEKWTRDSAAALGSETAVNVNSSIAMAREYSRDNPLPVTIVASAMSETKRDFSDAIRDLGPYQDRANMRIGPFNIQGGTLNNSDIDSITRQINQRMKQEVRGGRF